MSDSAAAFWQAFLDSGTGEAEAAAGATYSTWHFGTGGEMADELVDLVVHGAKRATAGALWSYEAEGEPIPAVGEYSVVTDGAGVARAIIRTASVDVVRFEDVGADFAAAEGEGDLSLEYWRDGHWRYFTRELAEIGREARPDMPVVCERFELIYPRP